MDAISFVLGIKSSHLRSTHLRDLVYRGRVLKTSRINADGTATEVPQGESEDVDPEAESGAQEEEQDTQSSTQRADPTNAWVMAVYEDDAGEEQRSGRRRAGRLDRRPGPLSGAPTACEPVCRVPR